ncbi:hypothetical protein HYS72_02195 [Candidatus Pacearchaeota archaeon]|nr:hypothetical protein [Candidatus Pacearchaeota archaeon]
MISRYSSAASCALSISPSLASFSNSANFSHAFSSCF